MKETKPFQTISSRIAWSCPWYQIRQDVFVAPDGNRGVYNIIEKEAAVWIVPITRDGQLVLIKHYRYTVDDWCWEVPAGSVKKGQNLLEAAVEELQQEIGGENGQFEYIGQFYTADGITNEIGHIFLATNITLGDHQREPAEIIEIHPKSIADVLHMAKTNQIDDGPSALAILLCSQQLQSLAG